MCYRVTRFWLKFQDVAVDLNILKILLLILNLNYHSYIQYFPQLTNVRIGNEISDLIGKSRIKVAPAPLFTKEVIFCSINCSGTKQLCDEIKFASINDKPSVCSLFSLHNLFLKLPC